MGGGPPCFPQNFSCSVVLWISAHLYRYFRLRDSHSLWSGFPASSTSIYMWLCCRSTTPYTYCIRFRLFPFRSPLLRESIIFFLFLRVLRCFSSPGSLPQAYFIQPGIPKQVRWVPPLGYLRVKVCLRLTAAFRSWPRPSSAPGAKASALRSL